MEITIDYEYDGVETVKVKLDLFELYKKLKNENLTQEEISKICDEIAKCNCELLELTRQDTMRALNELHIVLLDRMKRNRENKN